jgi:hypothetical protein
MTTAHTFNAGADTGALLAAAHRLDLTDTLATAEASHLGAHLATRRPALPVRCVRTCRAAIAAAGVEWRRREPVLAPRSVGTAVPA